jgi:hypothetical protein
MLVSPMGLRPEKGCAGYAQQKMKTTDPASRQRGKKNPHKCVKVIKESRGRIGHGSHMGA